MEIRDSRRVPGPNLLWDRASAQIDVALEADEVELFLEAHGVQTRRMLEALGWVGEELCSRRFRDGVSVALSAPVDALYPACEVNEWAFGAAQAVLSGREEPPLQPEAERLRQEIAEERAARSNMRALVTAAEERGLDCITDDDHASIGTGEGSRTFEAAAIPDPDTIDWTSVHDIPVALVTGTNGKTTTVRLLAAMVAAEGRTIGMSSTDWIQIGDEVLDRGDWSGPSGARTVLRDRRVQIALLETARGGMLRRGLGVRRANVALITNVGEDHLGEWGIEDLRALVETKFVVERALAGGGALVLNADDPEVVVRGARTTATVTWFSLDSESALIRAHTAAGGTAVVLDGEELVLLEAGVRRAVAGVRDVPFTMGGAARHNVHNALGAIGVAIALGLSLDAVARGLTSFRGDAEDNPGRLNAFEVGGVRCLIDFAHNPHGMAAVFDVLARFPAQRRGIMLGQAGDRDDRAIRELARVAWSARPDRVVLKEMPEHLRGREPGEVTGMLREELLAAGAPHEVIAHADDDLAAVRDLLAWSLPGDVLVLLVHSQRERVLALLQSLRDRQWAPGDEL